MVATSSGRTLRSIFPAYLDRPEVVARVRTNELRPSPFDFWAASLDDQFKSALSQNLALMIDRCTVTTYPWYAGTSFDATVGIDLVGFEVNTDGSAHLVARWVIRHAGSTEGSDARRIRGSRAHDAPRWHEEGGVFAAASSPRSPAEPASPGEDSARAEQHDRNVALGPHLVLVVRGPLR